MGINIKASIRRANQTALENILGKTDPSILVSFKMGCGMARESYRRTATCIEVPFVHMLGA